MEDLTDEKIKELYGDFPLPYPLHKFPRKEPSLAVRRKKKKREIRQSTTE